MARMVIVVLVVMLVRGVVAVETLALLDTVITVLRTGAGSCVGAATTEHAAAISERIQAVVAVSNISSM